MEKKDEKKLGFKRIHMKFGLQHAGDLFPTLHITMQRLKTKQYQFAMPNVFLII